MTLLMTWQDALIALKSDPGNVGARHPDMSEGWLVFWHHSGFHYHLNPITGSQHLFLVDETRPDWELVHRKEPRSK